MNRQARIRTRPNASNNAARNLAFALVFVLLILLPWALWWLLVAEKRLQVVILDKTVAQTNRREHRALIWILNHLRYVKGNDQQYDAAKDYYGFFPSDEPVTIRDGKPSRPYRIQEMPAELPDADLIYIADTYGVYWDDYYGEGIRRGDHSPRLYGGLKSAEVHAIASALHHGATLVAEYNSFASPTDDKTRAPICKLLGVKWTGWSARHFTDLTKQKTDSSRRKPSEDEAEAEGEDAGSLTSELPSWAPRLYEQQTGQPWDFHGPGFLFIKNNGALAVLQDEDDCGPKLCTFRFTPEGSQLFGVPAHDEDYIYWFDINMPLPGTRVLANYTLDLTPSGKQTLAEKGIPTTWPAVFHTHVPDYDTYYFAGDYVDSDEVPHLYRLYGWDHVKKLFSVQDPDGQASFYWNIYVPMMEHILSETYAKKGQRSPRRTP